MVLAIKEIAIHLETQHLCFTTMWMPLGHIWIRDAKNKYHQSSERINSAIGKGFHDENDDGNAEQ